jgi:DNA-binding MurR/RpiR family transcriptional regulator
MTESPSAPPLTDLASRMPSLPRQQQVLARTILESPELVAFGSVRDLASQLGMNSATIIRFAKSLGLSGYQALQAEVREAYLARAGARAGRREGGGAAAELAAVHRANLESAVEELDDDTLEAVVSALVQAGRILVCATGSAVVPGMILVRLLRHAGLRGELVDGSGVDRIIALRDVGAGDVVVVIGLWLAFDEQVRALAMAHAKGATTVAVVGSPASPLGRLADHVVLAPAQGTNLPFSVVATVAVVEMIVSQVAARSPDNTSEIEADLHDLYLREGWLAPAFPPRRVKRTNERRSDDVATDR